MLPAPIIPVDIIMTGQANPDRYALTIDALQRRTMTLPAALDMLISEGLTATQAFELVMVNTDQSA